MSVNLTVDDFRSHITLMTNTHTWDEILAWLAERDVTITSGQRLSGKLPIAEIVKQLGWRTGKDQKDDDVNQETVYTVSILYVPPKREEREITPASSAFDTFSQLGSILDIPDIPDIPEPDPPAPVPSITQDQPVGAEAAESTEQAVGHTAQANSHRRRISAVVPRAERVNEGRPSRRRRAPGLLGEA